MRKFRFALRPGWLALHIVSIALIVTMIFLGRWQLHVSESKHFSIQNFGYTIQWWLFSAFVAFFWFRLVRDASRRGGVLAVPPPEPQPEVEQDVPYRRYVMPTSQSPQPADDPVRAAYNDYLAGLNQDALNRDAQQ